jgi:hypothetical protein
VNENTEVCAKLSGWIDATALRQHLATALRSQRQTARNYLRTEDVLRLRSLQSLICARFLGDLVKMSLGAKV